MLYVLNTLIVPINFSQHPQVTVSFKRVTVEEAKAILANQNFVSAVGHDYQRYQSLVSLRFKVGSGF
jgi:hypothetical protein